MEQQVEYLKPQPSVVQKEAHQQRVQAASLSNTSNSNLDQINSSGSQNVNCAIGEEVLANLTVGDRQKLMNGTPFRMPKALRSDMTVIIIEILPEILVSDSHNFIEAIFTKDSINNFRRNFGHLKFSALRDKAIHVTKWRLQIDFVDSNKVFNSFQNMTIKLVIEQFHPYKNEILNQRHLKQALPIFKDPNVQTLIKNHRHWFSQNLLKKQCLTLQDLLEEQTRIEQKVQKSASGTSKNVFNEEFPSQFELPSLKEVLQNNQACSTGIQSTGIHPIGKANGKKGKKKMHRQAAGGQSIGVSVNRVKDCSESKDESNQEDEEESNKDSATQNHENLNFGGIIQKTQVFRFQARNFPDVRNSMGKLFDLRTDIESDFTEYVEQLQLKKAFQSQNLRINEMERLIIQEKGEQFYAEKKATKLRLWREQVEDEQRRMQLKIQIEYFQIGNNQINTQNGFGTGGTANTYETLFKKEKDNSTGQRIPGFRSSRRIIGYTLGRSAASVKRNLLRLLDSSKTGEEAAENNMKSKIGATASPQKGRPRFNSQENIIQLRNVEDSQKTQLQNNDNLPCASVPKPVMRPYSRKREPLSQYVVNPNSVLDDTESEQDSQDSFQAQLQKEMQDQAAKQGNLSQPDIMAPQADNVLQNVTIHREMFQQYLNWFENNHVALKSKFDQLVNADQPENSQQSQHSFSNADNVKLDTKNKNMIENSNQQIIDIQNQPKSMFGEQIMENNMNIETNPVQDSSQQNIIQDNYDNESLAQMPNIYEKNGHLKDQEMSIQEAPQNEHHLQLQELVSLESQKISQAAPNSQLHLDQKPPSTAQNFPHPPFHLVADTTSNYTALPLASAHDDPTESNLEDPTTSQPLTSTHHQADARCPFGTSVAGSNFNNQIDESSQEDRQDLKGLEEEDQEMEGEAGCEEDVKEGEEEREEVSEGPLDQEDDGNGSGQQEKEEEVVIRPVQTVYRPPFVLTELKEQEFVFKYSVPVPQPPKPIQQMSLDEKEMFDIEMEEYEAARHHEKIKQRREFLKQKKEKNLKEQELLQKHRDSMLAEEELSRQYLNQVYLQEQREREIKENNLRIEQEKLRQAEEARRLQEEEEEAQRQRMRQEEMSEQQDRSQSDDEPMNAEGMHVQTKKDIAQNLAVEGAQEGENDELDWGEGESNPESLNQSQRSNEIAQKIPSPQSIKNQEQLQNNEYADQYQNAQNEQDMDEQFDDNQKLDSNVPNQDDQVDEESEALSEQVSQTQEGLNFTDSEAKRQRDKCQTYIKNMGDKFIDQIDDGIKRNIQNDLLLRDANNQLNEDRLFDEAKQLSMEKSSRHRASLFSNQKNEGIESIGSVDINNVGGSQYFQKFEDDGSYKAKSSQQIDSPKFKSVTQDEAEESSLNDDGNDDRDREEHSQVPQNSAQIYDQEDDARESRSSQDEYPQNNETLQDNEQQDQDYTNEEEYPQQYQMEEDNQQDSYVDQQQEDENEHADDLENEQQDHCDTESHSEIEQEPETPGEIADYNDQDQMDEEQIDEAHLHDNNHMEENYKQEAERWSYNENIQQPEYQDEQNYMNEEEEEMEQEQQPQEPVVDDLNHSNIKYDSLKGSQLRNGHQSHRVNHSNYFQQANQLHEQPGIEEAEEEHSNEELDAEYDNDLQRGHPNQKPNIHPKNQQNSVAQGFDQQKQNHIQNQFRETIKQIDLNYTRKNVPEKATGASQSIQNNNYKQKNSQQHQGMIMTNGVHKRGPEQSNHYNVQSARSPKKEQRQLSARNQEFADITSPNQKLNVEENDKILQLQAQVEALQKQIGMFLDSKQVEKQASSSSHKVQISSSEQKRRPRAEPEADKFGSPKSCSQFNIGQQSPKVMSTQKAERIRPKINEASSQEAIASTFGKATQNEQSVNPDQEEDFSEEGPRFGGNDEYDQEVNQENFENEEEAQSIEQDEYPEQADEGQETFNEQVVPLDGESDEEDLPVFGSHMKKKLRKSKSDFDLDGSPGSSGSHRMSRSKSPENPHLNRIPTEKSHFNDSQSDVNAQNNQVNSYANQGYKRNYNQYKGSSSMMRHRSRSVDNGDDYEDEGSNDKRQRRASDSSSYRQGSRQGGRNNNDSESDKLTFKNLSEFASIEIMKSNKQNVQEELKKRELKQQTKSQQARQDYLARQSNNQSQGSAVFRSQNVERGQPQPGSLAQRKEKSPKDPQRYAKMPNSTSQQAQRASQHPHVEARQMRQIEDKVQATSMSHRSSNRQLPPQYQKDINQGQQFSSQSHHYHHPSAQYSISVQHSYQGSQPGMVQYLQNKYSNHRDANQSSGSQDPRNGQALGQQKQVRGQMTSQQIKQLQQRQQIRDSYGAKINGGDEGQGQQYSNVNKDRHQSPSKSHIQSSNYDQQNHQLNHNAIQNSEQKRANISGSQHPRSLGSLKKSTVQSAMRQPQYAENHQSGTNISNSGMKQGYSHSQNGNNPHGMYAQAQNQVRGHPQISQSPRITQTKQARLPQNYVPANAQNNQNSVIKGAGSLVGANKRLMGPRQADYYERDGDDYQGHRQYDNERPGSNPMKPTSSPNHHQQYQQHHPKAQGTPDHHHHVQKQLFQNDDRQAPPSTSFHPQSLSNSTQKKRAPTLPKQSDMLQQSQRSRGSIPPKIGANIQTTPTLPPSTHRPNIAPSYSGSHTQNASSMRQSQAAKAGVAQNGQRMYKGGQY